MLIDRMGVRVGGVSQAVVDLPHTRAAEFFGWHAGQLQHFCKSNATPAQVILKTTLETKHLHKVGRLELGQCWRPRCWSLRSHHFLGLRSPPPITLTPHHSPKTLRPIFSLRHSVTHLHSFDLLALLGGLLHTPCSLTGLRHSTHSELTPRQTKGFA
jgi:hypothetical protein